MTRVIAGEMLIVPVRGRVGDLDSIYTLNEVAARIWQLIDASVPVAQIIEVVAREFEVATEEARRDVLEFIESLEEAGLIRAVAVKG